jgi:hypothetical protein
MPPLHVRPSMDGSDRFFAVVLAILFALLALGLILSLL